MQMMTAVNTIRIEKGRGEEVASRFAVAKSVHTFKGFIRMEVWMKEDSPEYDELKICTTWEDHSYFDNWLKSRQAEKAHGGGRSKESEGNSPILGSELTTFAVKVQHLPAIEVKS